MPALRGEDVMVSGLAGHSSPLGARFRGQQAKPTAVSPCLTDIPFDCIGTRAFRISRRYPALVATESGDVA